MGRSSEARAGFTRRLGRAARSLAVAAVWLAVWQIACAAMPKGRRILVASPSAVSVRIAELLGEAAFWRKTGTTLLHIIGSYVLGAAAGALLAVLTAASDLLDRLFRPLLSVVRATPVVSFIILALVWMPRGRVPVFISFLMVLPIVWADLSLGIRETDRDLLEMARAYRFGRLGTLRHVYLPSVLPALLTALVTAAGFAWKAGIAAEVIGAPVGAIGSELRNAQAYLETTDLFAWTAVVIALSMVFERLIVWGVQAVSRRAKKDRVA